MTRVIFNLFKVSLFAFNTFYFLLGLALVIGSTFIYMNPNQLNSLAKLEYGREYANLVYTLNGVGIFFILVGFVGCLGILGDKSWLVFIYFCSLFAIFSLQFTCSVYIYLQSAHSFKALSTRVLRVIREEYGESGVHARALDYLQAEFKCCGWYSPRDWFDSSYIDPKYTLRVQPTHIQNVITMSPAYLYKIPHSCCANTYDLTCLLMNKFYEVGCERVVKYIYQTTELYIAWTLAFFNMFQLVILVLTLYVLCMMFYGNENSKEESNRHYYIDENNISSKLEDAINREQRRRRRRASRRPTRCIRKLFCIGKSRRVNEQSESDEDVYEDDYDEFNDANRYRERDQIYMTSYYL